MLRIEHDDPNLTYRNRPTNWGGGSIIQWTEFYWDIDL